MVLLIMVEKVVIENLYIRIFLLQLLFLEKLVMMQNSTKKKLLKML